ncbi:HHAT-like protein [Mya arenaria]|uniref:HHAT-like protein n=1 Tax=Mya arenaria TaxID=6604 RepID=A0ABY7FA13_MYAAR|nr:HHAT-like protein [Mya arenaria]
MFPLPLAEALDGVASAALLEERLSSPCKMLEPSRAHSPLLLSIPFSPPCVFDFTNGTPWAFFRVPPGRLSMVTGLLPAGAVWGRKALCSSSSGIISSPQGVLMRESKQGVDVIAVAEYDGILNLYDFAPGWGWLGREQDISNFEWHFWFLKFMAISPWYLGHIALGKIMEQHSLTSKKYVFLVYGLGALLKLVGWQTVGLCVAHSTIMYIISQIGLSVLVWITSLVLLSTLNFEICITFMKGLLEDDEEETWYYLLMFTLALSNIRATSFCLEACWNRKINQSQASEYKPRVVYLSLHLLRFLFWALFNEMILHFLYFNAIQNSLRVLKQVPLFTLAGLGFCHGQFFMLKYHVMFGYPGTVAKFDGLQPPDGPKYFDRGLYSFLKRYIYIPCGGSKEGFHRQVIGSLLCFMYIFYWHGAEYYILLFILLNYVGISLERIGSLLCTIPTFKHLETSVLSVAMVQRVHAFFSIPIFLMSCFSVFCFFGGKEVGYLFFSRLIINVA